MNVAECIVVNKLMPAEEYATAWSSIVVESESKERLINATVLALSLRPKLPPEVTALHGLILLYGPPGTGKTTLGRGLAHELSALVSNRKARLIEVNPHGLMSAEHGQSQQRVFELLAEHIPDLASDGVPTIVLLDEVESMAVARSAASLQANPADVHRATDAVLTALDVIARKHPHIVTVATSNFTDALDEAFISRADISLEMPLPSAEAIEAILRQTLTEFGKAFPGLAAISGDKALKPIAHRVVGLDGRRVRKLVTDALGRRHETSADPNLLKIEDIRDAAAAAAPHDTRPVAARDAAA